MGHFTPRRVLTISETVAPFPEIRIFSICMCIESLIVFALFSIRNALFVAQATTSGLTISSKFARYKWSMWIFTFGTSIGMIVVSVVSVFDNFTFHMLGAFLLFGCCGLYFLTSDFALRFACFPFWLPSWVATWLMVGFAVVFMVLSQVGRSSIAANNAASVMQYLLALTMVAKLFLGQFDIPKVYVIATEKETV
jgi:hypothetical protein